MTDRPPGSATWKDVLVFSAIVVVALILVFAAIEAVGAK